MNKRYIIGLKVATDAGGHEKVLTARFNDKRNIIGNVANRSERLKDAGSLYNSFLVSLPLAATLRRCHGCREAVRSMYKKKKPPCRPLQTTPHHEKRSPIHPFEKSQSFIERRPRKKPKHLRITDYYCIDMISDHYFFWSPKTKKKRNNADKAYEQ